ncbi:MAG: redox-sensing transcriptional repressor Rex [Dehalococcoidia bacterium]
MERAHRRGEQVAMEIPQVVVERLPIYARALATLEDRGQELVSSQDLGSRLGITPAQIRKDLSYFGRFGKQGRGYNVTKLCSELRQILGLDRQWRLALVGVGKLGRAILGYDGFAPQGFRIVEAFDIDPALVGKRINSLIVKATADLEEILRQNPVDIGIVAVPATAAQEVIDRLVGCGVQAILNYAPVAAHVPKGVHIRQIDPALAMQSMTFYLKAEGWQSK